MASEFVGYVPHCHRRMRAVALHHSRDESHGLAAKDRRARAPPLSAAWPALRAVGCNGQNLRVLRRQPRGRRCRRCSKIHLDSCGVQKFDDRVELTEFVLSSTRFDARPSKDIDRNEADARFLHQPDVINPDRLWPLLRAVVASKHDRGWRPQRTIALNA